jgi:hypothetical protein
MRSGRAAAPRANIAKVEDFGDKDLLHHLDLARIPFGEVLPLRRDARQVEHCSRLISDTHRTPHSSSKYRTPRMMIMPRFERPRSGRELSSLFDNPACQANRELGQS